ncbi:MAG: hypothetical protein PHQ81_02430 [Methanofollis sp.]|nr:hypothetical protein [Methanofollis sp.]
MNFVSEHIPKLTVVENDLELNFFVPEFLNPILDQGPRHPWHGGVGRHESMVGQRREGGSLQHIQCSLLRRGRTGEFWDDFSIRGL